MTEQKINELWERLQRKLALYGYRKFDRALREQIRPLLESLESTQSPALIQSMINDLVGVGAISIAMNEVISYSATQASKVVVRSYAFLPTIEPTITLPSASATSVAEIVSVTPTGSIGVGFGSPRFAKEMGEYIVDIGGQHIQEITDTTRKLVNKAFTDGIENKDTLRQLQKRILGYTLGGDGSGLQGRINVKARALLIARTETLMAIGQAKHLQMQEYPYVFEKVWIHTPQKNPRDNHQAINRTTRDYDKTWTLNGRKMLYAGHISGGAINNCSCKCSTLYKAKEDKDGNLIRK